MAPDEVITDEMVTESPGLNLTRLAGWLDRTRPGEVTGPLRASLLAGGRSNLTYRVDDGTRAWVVRRPPLGHVLATAHDMAREYRVLTALHPTGVPVPATYGLCTDPEVIGAQFYLMELVDGTAYRRADELAALGPERTRTIALRMVDTLVALHAVDPRRVGLGDLGRPEGFLARQVRRWKAQLDASRSRELAGIDRLHAGLAAAQPDGGTATVVHGDFRLDNLLVDRADRVAAVVDWEMATLADPLTDVGLFVVYHRLAALGGGPGITDASLAPGYPAEDELLARYARGTGADLSDLGFHLALACFKLAVICEGIHYRHVHGQTVGAGFELVGSAVPRLVDAGLAELEEYG